MADFVFRGMGSFLQHVHRGHEKPGGTEAALQGVVVPERLLQRMQFVAVGQALQRLDVGPIRLDREQQARPHAFAIYDDRARAAHTVFAAQMGRGQPEVVPEEIGQQPPRFDRAFVLPAVHANANAPASGEPGILHAVTLLVGCRLFANAGATHAERNHAPPLPHPALSHASRNARTPSTLTIRRRYSAEPCTSPDGSTASAVHCAARSIASVSSARVPSSIDSTSGT